METVELRAILRGGEDSRHQFKKMIANPDSLAGELVAFSNGAGGMMLVGVNDDGSIAGLTDEEVRSFNQLLSNTASQGIQPAINPVTENVSTEQGLVVVVTVPQGLNKPYQDKKGVFWVKSGADKRKATSREEIQRLFQASNLLHADTMPVLGTTLSDLDIDYFRDFFQKKYARSLENMDLPLQALLKNMNLLQEECLNVCGVLLFSNQPQYRLPAFIVKARATNAVDLSTTSYTDEREITGKLADVFEQTVSFIINNLHHVQGDQGFNSIGQPEIPRESIEELVANALIHRDYFISAPVRVFVFADRVEIISPGHLPNNLTVENIKAGNSNFRNPVIATFATALIPYSGIGSGIIRALAIYPHIDFIDDREGNQFKAVLKRVQESVPECRTV
jgi:ATP-dependent DNA helicase RecG